MNPELTVGHTHGDTQADNPHWPRRERALLEEYIKQQKLQHYEYVKRYVARNREKTNKIHRDFYYRNRDKLLEKQICQSCGGRFSKPSKATHEKSQKHQRSINQGDGMGVAFPNTKKTPSSS